MTENQPPRKEHRDESDISALARELELARYARAPRDVVPRTVPPEGAPAIPVGPAVIRHAEILVDPETGVPVAADEYENTGWVAEPVTRESLRKRGIHLR